MSYRLFFGYAVGVAVILSSDAFAQEPSSKLDALLACQSVVNDTERLRCFDNTALSFSEATEKGEIVTVEKETIKTIERESFGFNLPSIPKLSSLFGISNEDEASKPPSESEETIVKSDPERSVSVESSIEKEPSVIAPDTPVKTVEDNSDATSTQQVTLTISRVGKHQGRKLKFLFTNGQIWEQVDSASLPKIKLGEGKIVTAKITKGSLGSFFLRINGKGTAIKVRRAR